MRGYLIALCTFSLGSYVFAADLLVPGEHATIQAAVNAASDGDRILVSAGLYTERVQTTKSLEFIGVDGAEVTFLDARGAPGDGSALALLGLSSFNLVQGFTIRGDQGRDAGLNPQGAGIYKLHGSIVIEDCVIEDCTISNALIPGLEEGAGVYTDFIQSLIIRNSVLRNNGEGSLRGGAVYSSAFVEQYIGCRFENNSAPQGGAIYSPSIDLIRDCVFVGNSSSNGGAVSPGDIVELHGSVFDSNTSSGDGGAINGEVFDAFQCVFSNNSANGEGGAIRHVGNSSTTNIESSLFYNNTAASGSCVESSVGIVIYNSILWNNGANQLSASGSIDVQYSIVEGGYTGDGNLDADPMFVDPMNGDFNLAMGSPAIDAGSNVLIRRDVDDLNNNGIVSDGYPFDLIGNARHTQDLSVPDTGVADLLSFPIDLGPLERVVNAPTDGNEDCNGNMINDLIDIMGESETDLNENLIPDSCDIASGVLTDADMDGVPDEYQTACLPDLNEDGNLNFLDVSLFLSLFSMGCP